METLNLLVEDLEWILVEDSSAPGHVRRSAVALAQRLRFSETRVGEIAIAATELATNLHVHAVEGAIVVRLRRNAAEAAVELVVLDGGPGMADLDLSAENGHSTRGTLGIGLGSAIKLATSFDGYSLPGRGTVMVATFWPRKTAVAVPKVGALTRKMNGETVCGDACAERSGNGVTTIFLADGLGHGEPAAVASREAVRCFLAEDDGALAPADMLRRFDAELRRTRGAAAAVARIDPTAARVTFAGVGNVAGWVDDGERRRALASSPGIVGNNARVIREFELELPNHALVILHSDGVTNDWDLSTYPGLRERNPQLVAATLMRDAGRYQDDASVIVAKAS